MDCWKVIISLAMVTSILATVFPAQANTLLERCQLKCERMHTDCNVHEDCAYSRKRCSALCDLFFNEMHHYTDMEDFTTKREKLIKSISLRNAERKKHDTVSFFAKRVVEKRACLNDCEGVRDLCHQAVMSVMGVFACNQGISSCRASCR